MSNLWGREPALVAGAVMAVVNLAAAFGFDVTGEQLAAINTAVVAVLAVLVRQTVTAPDTIEERAEAARLPLTTEVPFADPRGDI